MMVSNCLVPEVSGGFLIDCAPQKDRGGEPSVSSISSALEMAEPLVVTFLKGCFCRSRRWLNSQESALLLQRTVRTPVPTSGGSQLPVTPARAL